MAHFDDLLGQTLKAILGLKNQNEKVVFITNDNIKYQMYHEQDCCESVYITDVEGDIKDLLHSPIILAEEAISNKEKENNLHPEITAVNKALNRMFPKEKPEEDDSNTWTFYKIGTKKGSVTIRWLGASNGYYSESVDFIKIDNNKYPY